jgi:hypothetical protein
MYLRFLHVFPWINSLLILSTQQYSKVWVCHSLFIHSPTEENVHCFQVLATVN